MAKCDKCDKPATIYLTEILEGQKIQKHLCEECAAAEGITVKTNVPVSQLLEELVMQSAGGPQAAELKCDVCGMTFREFRQHGLLGCPNDYEVFSRPLDNLLQRAHGGSLHHIGKTPPTRFVLEEKLGGRWYSEHEDGSVCENGKVLVWDPTSRLVIGWQLTATWQYDPSFSTDVELRFIAETPKRTRVELEHRDLERYGATAPDFRKSIDSDGGWSLIIGEFARIAAL